MTVKQETKRSSGVGGLDKGLNQECEARACREEV